MKYGNTFLKQSHPWGLFYRNGSRVLCADGQIRAVEMSETADTFFSISARLRFAGKWVTGYVSTEESKWIRGGDNSKQRRAYAFRPHTEGAPPALVWPVWEKPFNQAQSVASDLAFNAILEKAYLTLSARVKYLGSFVRVHLSAREIEGFNKTWPGSEIPNRAAWFEFQKSNGDLLDISPHLSKVDGPELSALAEDAKKAAGIN